MQRFVVVREHWKHGDVDAEHVVAEFATRAEAEAWVDGPAGQAARRGGAGTEGVTLRIDVRDG